MAIDNNVGPASAPMTMIQALRSAMDVMLERDGNVVVFGQDVGYFGGVFRCTEGLQAKYGSSRVFDTPISEGGIVGVAVGMGAYGLRPVCEIQFADYFYPASDQIVSEAARLRYRSVGEFIAPMTIRMPCGGGIYGGQTHSQSPEAMFTQVCGLRTVMPSNPYDAKGRRQAYTAMPQKLSQLSDDPYRSLAGQVRKAGGYAKDTTPFAEFVWADFFRPLLTRKQLQLNDNGVIDPMVLTEALAMAHSTAARCLPGWSGRQSEAVTTPT